MLVTNLGWDTHRVKIILGSISKYYSMHRQSFTLSFTFSSGLDSRLSPHTLRCIDTVLCRYCRYKARSYSEEQFEARVLTVTTLEHNTGLNTASNEPVATVARLPQSLFTKLVHARTHSQPRPAAVSCADGPTPTHLSLVI